MFCLYFVHLAFIGNHPQHILHMSEHGVDNQDDAQSQGSQDDLPPKQKMAQSCLVIIKTATQECNQHSGSDPQDPQSPS